MSRHESGIQSGKPNAVAACELGQPGIRDLFVALKALVGDMLVTETLIHEVVHSIRLDEGQIFPGCRRGRICREHHVEAEKLPSVTEQV